MWMVKCWTKEAKQHVLVDLHVLDAQVQITKMINEAFAKIDGL
jgi:hypothetical protein